MEASIYGQVGEGKVIQELNKLPRNSYYILNDIMLKDKDTDYYCQIDHIVISIYGIFLIETKNWTGKIYGDQYSKTWKKYINGKKFEVINPVKQNWTHKRILANILKEKVQKEKIQSIIVITGNSQLVQVHSDVPVLKAEQLNEYILKSKEAILEHDTVIEVFNKINESNILDVSLRKQHISKIKNNYSHDKSIPRTNDRNRLDVRTKELKNNTHILKYFGYDKRMIHNLSDEDVDDLINRIRSINTYGYLKYGMDIKALVSNPFKRMFAFIIELLIFLIPFCIYDTTSTQQSGILDSFTNAPDTSLYLFLGILIIQFLLFSKSTSIGKFLFGMKVVDVRTIQPLGLFRMLIREIIGKLICASLYGFGFLLVLFNLKRQGLHDFIIRSTVINNK